MAEGARLPRADAALTVDADERVAAPLPAAQPFPAWLVDLYRMHGRSLARYLQHKYGSGPPEPDDVAHEAFARLASLAKSERAAIDNPRAFLFRMAENLLISAKRKARTAAAYATDENYLAHARSELTPERVLTAKDQLDVVERAIRAMPDQRRRCFIMHRYDDLTYAEISRRCGLSANGVKGHVERAMRDISNALTDAKRADQGAKAQR